MSVAAIETRRGPARDITISIIVGIVLTGLSYVVATKAGWIDTVNFLEAFAVFTSYTCTLLCVWERRINYPIGAISNAAYAFLFYQTGLMGSAAVTAWLTLSLIYGWFRWKKDTDTKPVGFVEAKWWPIYILATGVAFAGGWGIYHLTGAQVVWTDLAIMAGSILAQFLLDNKKLENWMVWAIVNVFAIYTYFNAGLLIVGFQYIFFLGNTVFGFVMWMKSKKRSEIGFPPEISESEALALLAKPAPPKFTVPEGTPRIVLRDHVQG
jgi:nicotinamide mononucleotide transporter